MLPLTADSELRRFGAFEQLAQTPFGTASTSIDFPSVEAHDLDANDRWRGMVVSNRSTILGPRSVGWVCRSRDVPMVVADIDSYSHVCLEMLSIVDVHMLVSEARERCISVQVFGVGAEPTNLLPSANSLAAAASISVSTSPSLARVSKALDAVMYLDQDGRHREAGRAMMRYVEGWFRERDLAAVNGALTTLSPAKCSPWPTVGLLRSSYRARGELPAWASALRRAEEALRERGEPSTELLAGLAAS